MRWSMPRGRFDPGARVHLQIERGARHFAVVAQVVRCAVFALGGDKGVVYRGAMRFEQHCEDLWEPVIGAQCRGTDGDAVHPSRAGNAR